MSIINFLPFGWLNRHIGGSTGAVAGETDVLDEWWSETDSFPRIQITAAGNIFVGTGTSAPTLDIANGGHISGVASWDNRTGNVVMTAADVATALGYTAANDADVAHMADPQTITAAWTFSANPVLNPGALPESATANLTSDLAAKLALSTVTTKGDTLVASGAAAIARLPVGTDGYVLTSRSTATDGVDWEVNAGATYGLPTGVDVSDAGTASAGVATVGMATDSVRTVSTAVPGSSKPADVAARGTSTALARADHLHGREAVPVTAFNTRTGAVLPGNADYLAVAVGGLTGAVAATRFVGGTASGAPTTGTFAIGDFVIDQTAKLWVCTVAGTPGTWVAISGGSSSLPGITVAKNSTGQSIAAATWTKLTWDTVLVDTLAAFVTPSSFKAPVAGYYELSLALAVASPTTQSTSQCYMSYDINPPSTSVPAAFLLRSYDTPSSYTSADGSTVRHLNAGDEVVFNAYFSVASTLCTMDASNGNVRAFIRQVG